MTDELWTIRNFQPNDFEKYFRLHLESEKHDQSGRRVSKSLLAEALGHPQYHPEKDLFKAVTGFRSNIFLFLSDGLKQNQYYIRNKVNGVNFVLKIIMDICRFLSLKTKRKSQVF